MRVKIMALLRRQTGLMSGGFTLALLVIAALVLLVLYSVGFNFITTTEGTKMLAYLKQISEANREFRTIVGVWPQVAVEEQTPVDIMMALVSPDVVKPRYRDKVTNLLPDIEVIDGVVRHPFGRGGTITQTPVEDQGITYMLIVMTNVPALTFEDADRSEDGTANWTEGRLQTDEDPATNSTVTVTYLANPMDVGVGAH